MARSENHCFRERILRTPRRTKRRSEDWGKMSFSVSNITFSVMTLPPRFDLK